MADIYITGDSVPVSRNWYQYKGYDIFVDPRSTGYGKVYFTRPDYCCPECDPGGAGYARSVREAKDIIDLHNA